MVKDRWKKQIYWKSEGESQFGVSGRGLPPGFQISEFTSKLILRDYGIAKPKMSTMKLSRSIMCEKLSQHIIPQHDLKPIRRPRSYTTVELNWMSFTVTEIGIRIEYPYHFGLPLVCYDMVRTPFSIFTVHIYYLNFTFLVYQKDRLKLLNKKGRWCRKRNF